MKTTAAIDTRDLYDAFDRIGDNIRRHWAMWAWAVVLLLINLPVLWGRVRHGMLFFPDAVIEGQWWRVVTYPLVHLSWYHLMLDAGGFLILYACLEERRTAVRALYIVGPGVGTLLMALAADPFIGQRGLSGLSGIAHGLMAVTAMEMLRHKSHRTWGWISLLTVATNSAYELWSGQVFFEFMHMGLCGHPVAASHGGGVIGGLVSYLLVQWVGRCRL